MQPSILLLGLCAIVTSAIKAPSARECSKHTRDITYLKREITHPINFCTTYLSARRTRSPVPRIQANDAVNACACILKKAGRPMPKVQRLASAPKVSSASCNTKYKKSLGREFKHPLSFCRFYSAIGRKQSFVSGLNYKQVAAGCKCLLSPVKTTKSVKKSSKTTTTKSTKTSTTSRTATTPSTITTVTSSQESEPVTTSGAATTTSTSGATTVREAPEVATALASPQSQFTQFYEGYGVAPQRRPEQITQLDSSDSPYDAVQQCADFAQSSGLSIFIVLDPANRTVNDYWYCGGWSQGYVGFVVWENNTRVGAAYGYSLPLGPEPTTTSFVDISTTSSEPGPTSAVAETTSTVAETTSTSETTTTQPTTTTAPPPVCDYVETSLGYSRTTTSTTFSGAFGIVYNSYRTTAAPVSTIRTTTFDAVSTADAVVKACGQYVFDSQSFFDSPAFEVYQSVPQANWVCVMFDNTINSGAANYNAEGATNDVECVYGYEQSQFGYTSNDG